MSADLLTISSRVSEASKVLKVKEKRILQCLSDKGIEDDEMGLKLLNATTTTEYDLWSSLMADFGDEAKDLQLKAAAALLKGKDPFGEGNKEEPVPVTKTDQGPYEGTSVVASLAEVLKESRPIESLKDRELLEIFDAERDARAQQELERRAKGQRFVVLKPVDDKEKPGSEPIDIDQSLTLLKKSRKMKIPTMISGDGNKIVPVYRLSELDLDDRLVEICPICGEVLFRGYCEQCQLNFTDISDGARSYMKLVVDAGVVRKESYSDRKALWASANKGINDLRQVWPSLESRYRELKLAGELPRLRMIRNLPPEQVADPFHVAGNRKY